jgi:L-ascorbate metabolism protein UlaG (beta-lactamase superfamily)
MLLLASLLHCTVAASALTWTHLGINGQLWTFRSGTRILVDPILVGELTFFGMPKLYTASPRVPCDPNLREELMAGSFDALVLSQGWEDHCHLPTLSALRDSGALEGKDIIGPPSSAGAVAACGLSDSFVELAHGGSRQVHGVTLRAVPGARLGPPWQRRENGICATGGGEPAEGGGLFYEPRGSWFTMPPALSACLDH